MQEFYAVFTTVSFFLVGLWWNVIKDRQAEWMNRPNARRMAYTIYLAFLIPGMMSLGAQLSADLKFLWRVIFVIVGVLGIWITLVQIPNVGRLYPNTWFVRRARWLIVGFYLVLIVFASWPGLERFYAPLKPLQIEALLLSTMMFLGVNMAWEFMAQPKLIQVEETEGLDLPEIAQPD